MSAVCVFCGVEVTEDEDGYWSDADEMAACPRTDEGYHATFEAWVEEMEARGEVAHEMPTDAQLIEDDFNTQG